MRREEAVRPLFSTIRDSSSVETSAVESKMTEKDVLIDVATKLKDEFGLFLVDKKAKKELADAVEGVEATFVPSMMREMNLIGTWDLISTTSTSNQGIDTSSFLQGPLKQLTDKISSTTNKYVTVQQAIKTDSTGIIDRVDHILSYKPPSALTEFIDNLPTQLASLNVNPLDVSDSKIILVHKAKANADASKISLTLQSVILNVAGNSTYLDPKGKDIAGINLPLGDFLGGGEFTTTYMDEDVRVSRGKQAGLDVLRVFVKSTKTKVAPIWSEIEIPDAEIIAAVEGSSEEETSEEETSEEETSEEETPDDSKPSDVEDEGL